MHSIESRHAAFLAAVLACASIAAGLTGCHGAATEPDYAPGLGEIMTLTQMRHTKLWLAGQARNWDLAAYELDELSEGFEDAIHFHPTHKDSPVPLDKVIPLMVDAPVAVLRQAIVGKDGDAFVRAYDGLTTACNGCHQATNFAFNVVQRPAGNPFPNQVFAPAR